MTTAKKTTAKKTTDETASTEPSRRERLVGWAELGLDSASSAQKQWNDIAFGYAELALKAWRDGLAWTESYYQQSKKAAASLADGRNERARAVLERLS